MNEQAEQESLAMAARKLWTSLIWGVDPSPNDLVSSFQEEMEELLAALSIMIDHEGVLEQDEIEKSLKLIAEAIVMGMPVTKNLAYVRNELARRRQSG